MTEPLIDRARVVLTTLKRCEDGGGTHDLGVLAAAILRDLEDAGFAVIHNNGIVAMQQKIDGQKREIDRQHRANANSKKWKAMYEHENFNLHRASERIEALTGELAQVKRTFRTYAGFDFDTLPTMDSV